MAADQHASDMTSLKDTLKDEQDKMAEGKNGKTIFHITSYTL